MEATATETLSYLTISSVLESWEEAHRVPDFEQRVGTILARDEARATERVVVLRLLFLLWMVLMDWSVVDFCSSCSVSRPAPTSLAVAVEWQ